MQETCKMDHNHVSKTVAWRETQQTCKRIQDWSRIADWQTRLSSRAGGRIKYDFITYPKPPGTYYIGY